MAFHRYLGVTFICTVAFHRLALDRRGNILGGIIGIHQCYYIHIVLECIVVCMEACSAVCGNVV